MKKYLLAGVFSLASIMYTQAQFSFKTEYIGKSSYRDDDTDQKIADYQGASVTYKADLNIPLSSKMNDNGLPKLWSVNMAATYVNLDNYNFKEKLVGDEIFNFYFGVGNTTPISKKWIMATSIGVGIFSPTTKPSRITRKQLLGNLAVLFICNMRSNLQIGTGIAFNNTFGFPMAFPALYLNWSTEGRWNANVNMTEGVNTSFGYRYTDNLSFSIVWEVTGQTSFETKNDKDMMFCHLYMVAGLRSEFKIGERLTVPLTFGLNTMRFAGYDKRTLKAMFVSTEPGGYFQASPYLSVGININF